MKIYIGIGSFVGSLLIGVSSLFFLKNFERSETSDAVSTAAEVETMPASMYPAVMIALEPGEKLTSNIKCIVSSANIEDGGLIGMIVDQAFTGINLTRPLGGFIYGETIEEEPFVFLAGLPVKDIDELKGSLETLGSINETAGGLTWKLDKGNAFKLHQSDDYLFITNDRSKFDNLPSDPRLVFSSLLEGRSMALKVLGQQIPKSVKDEFWSNVLKGMNQSVNRRNEMRYEQMSAQLKDFVYSMDEFTFGLAVDQAANSIQADSTFTGMQGSRMSQRSVKNMKMDPSRFAGFTFKNALFAFNVCNNDWTEDLKEWQVNVNNSLEAVAQLKNDAVGSQLDWFNEIITETIESERTDFGLTVIERNREPVVALGVYLADTKKISSALESNVKAMKLNNVPTKYRVLESSEKDIVFHEFVGTNDKALEGLRPFYGETSTIVIGLGDQAVYFAAGDLGFELLERCIQQSRNLSAQPPITSGEINLCEAEKLIPVDYPLQSYIVEMLQSAKDSDQIKFETNPIENGYASSLRVELGVVRFVGEAVNALAVFGAAEEARFNSLADELNAN